MDTVELMRDFLNKGFSQEEAYKIVDKADSPEVKAAVILKAFGIPQNLIETHFGISPTELKTFLLVPSLSAINNEIINDLLKIQDDKYFENLLPRAMQVKVELLDNPDASPILKDKVASDIIDRVKGKPRQSLEVKSLNYNIQGAQEELDSQIQAVNARIKELTSLKTKQLKEAEKV